MTAWMQKGVVIHDAVKAAQRGCSSFDKSKKVTKSVETSDRPRMTLKKMNLQSAIILATGLNLTLINHLAQIFLLSHTPNCSPGFEMFKSKSYLEWSCLKYLKAVTNLS